MKKYWSKELSKERENSRAKGTEGCNLESVFPPVIGSFWPNIYQRQVKNIRCDPVYGSGFDLIVFLDSELNKPEPVLPCRCLRAKVQIEHSCIFFTGKYRCARNLWVQKEILIAPPSKVGSSFRGLGSLFKVFHGRCCRMNTPSSSDPSKSHMEQCKPIAFDLTQNKPKCVWNLFRLGGWRASLSNTKFK